jgi:hypothetical protein
MHSFGLLPFSSGMAGEVFQAKMTSANSHQLVALWPMRHTARRNAGSGQKAIDWYAMIIHIKAGLAG